jgi:type I restriction enzyme R subunit
LPTPDISERSLEDTIEAALTSGHHPGEVIEPPAGYDRAIPGGYLPRSPTDYDRALCLLPDDVVDFVIATQPKEWRQLQQHHGDETKVRFLKRLAREIERKGTLEVLRRGIKDSGVRVRLAYFRPHSGLNEELQRLYEANLFSLVRQLRYRREGEESLDVVTFLNGLPIFTAELKNPFTGQTVAHAVRQYRQDRDPREDLFAFGRCLAHFAVDPEQVYVTTRLAGPKTRFLPFDKGYNHGAGNPPPPKTKGGYKTAYLWEEVWAKDSVLNLVQHFVHRVQQEEAGEAAGGQFGAGQAQLFPRYHQLDAVRRLVAHAREHGPGQSYLVQHSAGSGKSFTIAWLAHWLSVLHDDQDRRVFDSIVVITDRRVLDQQLQETIRQFEQTLGVVENIDTTAKQLKQALEEGKTIIVTTLQKFPVIVEEIGELPGQRFAIVVDEAHSSQSGEATKALKSVLAAGSLEEAEAEEGGEIEDLEDRIVAEMRKRGRLANASTFAFTATPKQKTLELFGRRRPDGKFEPFSLYSMRQAIEEGFILDVLASYTTYKTYWKLLKKIEDDPRYDKAKAQYLLKAFVDLHEHAIRQKVEIMVEHFHERVQHRIGGRAKAMIVTRSRKHCVRYKLALDAYLKEKGYPYQSLVAFSGTVKDEGADFTETGMNGLPESQTKAAFERPEMRFLVVANKFQTGFDQPLLHTMYVDKRLGGVNAVQTLSRLNRTHPEKEETMVLDFANDADTIQKDFEPYYETTLLSEATDPNLLYDRQHDLEEFGVFTGEEVDAFAALYFGHATTLDFQAQLYQALHPIKERAESRLTEEALGDFRGALQDYVRQYAFLSQVIPFSDPDLEKLYVFARLLRRYLKAPEQELPRDIQQKIDMDSLRIQRTYTGTIDLERGARDLGPLGGREGRGPHTEELEPLSEIIRELNERFGADLGPEDRITLGRVLDQAEAKDSLRLSVENNTEENARLAFEQVVTDLLQELVDTNFKLYKRIADDRDFSAHLMTSLFDQYRKRVQNGGLTEEKILEEIQAGETKHRELKATLRWNLHTEENDDRVTHAALKTIAAFQNSEGGVLYLGVGDEGEIVGVEHDGFPNDDKFLLHLSNVVKSAMGRAAAARIAARVWMLGGKAVCRVECPPSPKPVFLKFRGEEKFYVRSGPSTEEMGVSEMHEYVGERFGG